MTDAKTNLWAKAWRRTWIDDASIELDLCAIALRQYLAQHVGRVDDDGTGWATTESGAPVTPARMAIVLKTPLAAVHASLDLLRSARIAVECGGEWGTLGWWASQAGSLRAADYLARRATAGAGATMWVYFIQAGDSGPIKIGSSNSPTTRLSELQIGSALDLRLLRQLPGTADDERALHARFAAHRIRGEWFEPSPEVLEEVSRGDG